MTNHSNKHFNLPYLQYDCYNIAVFSTIGSFSDTVENALRQLGYAKMPDSSLSCKTSSDWLTVWNKTSKALQESKALNTTSISISAGGEQNFEITSHKPPAFIQEIADNIWVGESLINNRIMCYFQSIVNEKGKVFGYESFVRAIGKDDEIIGGGKVINASKALNIEYMIDRHLHVEAVKTFSESDFAGFLFVNFLSGFIHRPAVYLDGLNESVKLYGVVPKNLVLELTSGETAKDMKQLKSICEYAKMQGYSVAIDDITTVENAKKFIGEVRPDFVKLDTRAIGSMNSPATLDVIKEIVGLVHGIGSTAIAESVETENSYNILKSMGVDLFQGYYFSEPSPATASVAKVSNSAFGG